MPAASNKQERLEEVKKEVDELARSAGSAAELMRNIVKLLHDQMLKYNWVGFYMLAKSPAERSPMLVLGAFQGAMTPHSRIPLHQGICGAAASTGKTVVVDDVNEDPHQFENRWDDPECKALREDLIADMYDALPKERTVLEVVRPV